jgi:predicted phage terminase large subunit-like protein
MEELADLLTAMSPSELEAFARELPRQDRQLLERVMAERTAMGWRADPASMAAHLDPTYRTPPHIRYLSSKFVDLTNGTSPRQIWNLPGRRGKTTLIRWGLAWLLDRHPEGQSIFTSYGDKLADETGAAVRDILRVHSNELRVTLRRDRQERGRFVTDEGGGLLTAGINATITGYGVSRHGIMGLDDPYKNWAEAHSESRRLHVSQQVKGTLRNRLDDERAGFLVCHHRMHHLDLTADLKKAMEDETGEAWELVVLPALAVEGDPLGRQPGEPLDPEAFPLESVLARAKALGSYLASGLEQQHPSPEEGNEIKRAWFHLADRGEVPTGYDQALTSWDLKLFDQEAGDYVVGQAWVRTGADFWLRDQIRGQYDHATTANAIALLSVRNPDITAHAVEYKGSASQVMPELRKARPDYVVTPEMAGRLGMTEAEAEAVQALRRRGMPGLIGHPVTEGSKPVRARTFIAPTAEAGNVHLVVASWTPHLLDEVAAFPNGSNDDQVDAMSQALQRLGVGTSSATPPRRAMQPPAVAAQASAPTVVRRRSSVVAPGRRRR